MRLLISRIAAIALNFLLLAAATYFAARSVDDVFVMWWTAPVSSPVRLSAAAPSVRHLVRASYEPIVERDVFNSVKEAPEPEEPVVQDLDLHLKLIGTSHLSNTEPFAIIEDQRNQIQSLYKLNTQVADAGKLVTIEKERVLIDHGGQMVALEIPKNASTASAGGNADAEPIVDPSKMEKVDAFRKEQERIIAEHKAHPRRSHQGLDLASRRDERQAEKESRRAGRGTRRGYGGFGSAGNGGGAPRLPVGADKIFQPQAATGGEAAD